MSHFEVSISWPNGSGVSFFDTLAEVVAYVKGFRMTTITGIKLGGIDAYQMVMATAFAKELPAQSNLDETGMIEAIDGDRCRNEDCKAHGPHNRDGEERWCSSCGQIWICLE